MKVHEYRTVVDELRLPILKERESYKIDGRKSYSNPELIAELIGDTVGLRNAVEEYAYCIAMDNAYHVLGLFEVGHGTSSFAVFDIRGLMQKALLVNASAIAIAHNHPSNTLVPSEQDIALTEKVEAACTVMDMQFVDHVIVAEVGYYSFRAERG